MRTKSGSPSLCEVGVTCHSPEPSPMPSLRCNPFITAVKPAELRDSSDPSACHDLTGNRALFAKR